MDLHRHYDRYDRYERVPVKAGAPPHPPPPRVTELGEDDSLKIAAKRHRLSLINAFLMEQLRDKYSLQKF